MSRFTKYKLYQKYETRGSQEAIPCYPNVFSIDGDGTMPLVIVEENSRDCGYTGETQPIYRWYQLPIDTYYYCDACQDAQYKWVNLPIAEDWECVGTTKYYKQKKQVSVDGGSTWTDVTPPQYQRGAVYEQNSSSCGYRTRTTTGSPYCEQYDKYVDVYSQYSTDGGNTWQTTATTPTMVEHNSEYCGYIEPQYRTTSGDTYCSGYNKYVPVYSQVSYDGGVTWETTATTNVLLEQYSSDCGYVPLTRWVESGWTCIGYDKYVNNVQQISYDNGQTWQNTSNTSASTLIEADSSDCGYIEPQYRTTSGDPYCTGYDKYVDVYSQVSYDGGSTWQTTATTPTLVEASSIDCGAPLKLNARYNGGINYYKVCDSNTTLTSGDTRPNGYTYTAMTSAEVGDCVTTIGGRAFGDCTSLTSVTIGSGVTSIDNSAFYRCSGLTSIDIPSSVTSIGGWCFVYCSNLREITIPSGVTSINDLLFSNCTSLTSVTMPSGVTTIGTQAFYRCTSLSSVTIPNTVTSIGNTAFSGCTSLRSIEIPSSVTSIDHYVFHNCSALTSVTVNAITPPTSTDDAFDSTNNCPIYVPSESVASYKAANGWSYYASRIQAIPTPKKLVCNYSNGTSYSADCNSNTILTSADTNVQASTMVEAIIGDCVTEIGERAFFNYYSSFYSLSSCTIGSGVTNIGTSAFAYCSGLTSIEIPNSVTSIENTVFSNCSGLTSIDIPDSVTSIGQGVFSYCTSLTSCTIGTGLTSINSAIFYNCTNLTSVTINATTPPTLGNFVFEGTPIESGTGTIYVPSGSVNAYKAASGWSAYADIIQAIP